MTENSLNMAKLDTNMDIYELNIDNENRNNYDPEKWGEPEWYCLFVFVFSYPTCSPSEIIQKNMKTYLLSLMTVLPCNNCRDNFGKHIKKFPLTDQVLKNRKNLLNWLCNIKNEIRIIQKKKPMDNKELISHYMSLYKEGGMTNKNNNYIYWIIISILLGTIVYISLDKSR